MGNADFNGASLLGHGDGYHALGEALSHSYHHRKRKS